MTSQLVTWCPSRSTTSSETWTKSLIVVKSEAQISIKHHFFHRWTLSFINSLPLISLRVTSYCKLWSPTFQNKRFIIIIIEDSWVWDIRPKTFISRFRYMSSPKSMCTRDCGCKFPSILSSFIYMLNKDVVKCITAFLWIRKSIWNPWAFLRCGSSNCKIALECI